MLVALTIQSRKVFGKSACDNPERYCGWFCVHSSSEPPRHSLNFSFVSFIYQMQKCIPGAGLLGKQVMSRTCAVRYSALSVWKACTSTRNQIYASDTSRNPLQSYLVFHSNLDILLKTSFWANFNLPCDIILHYFDIILQYSKEREQKRWETRRRPAGEIAFNSFTKITREMNQ